MADKIQNMVQRLAREKAKAVDLKQNVMALKQAIRELKVQHKSALVVAQSERKALLVEHNEFRKTVLTAAVEEALQTGYSFGVLESEEKRLAKESLLLQISAEFDMDVMMEKAPGMDFSVTAKKIGLQVITAVEQQAEDVCDIANEVASKSVTVAVVPTVTVATATANDLAAVKVVMPVEPLSVSAVPARSTNVGVVDMIAEQQVDIFADDLLAEPATPLLGEPGCDQIPASEIHSD